MAENTEATTQENTSETKPEVKTFTQEDVDRIVQERLARSKKGEKKQTNEPTQPSEATQQASKLEALRQENAKLTKQIATQNTSKRSTNWHTSIANKYGISDPSIIIGENEEEAEAFAKKLLTVKNKDTAHVSLHTHCDCEVIPDWGEKYNQAILRGYDPRVYNRIYNQASELWETSDANRLHLEKGQRPFTEDEQRIVDYATKSTIRWYGNKAVHESDEYRRWNRQGKSKDEVARHDRALSRLRKEAETNVRNDLNSKKPLKGDQSWHMISSIMRLQNPQNLTDGQRIEDAMVGDMKMSDWMTFRDKLAQRYLTTTKRSDKMPPLVPDNVGTITLGGKFKLPTSVYNHIAYGAYDPKKKKFLGGHLNGYGWIQRKDEFPPDWTMDDILIAAKHVIQHPLKESSDVIEGEYHGFHLYVVYDERKSQIRTISPRNGGEG